MAENYKIENNKNNPSNRPPLGTGQKIAAVVLGIFAIAVIVLWFAQFKKSISAPRPINDNSDLSQNQENNSDEALKNKDTDLDGLSDWDELNLYKTSPYLEDSDSDGNSDKKEIDAGKDPNCPEGRDCSPVSPAVDNPEAEDNKNNSSLNSLLNKYGSVPPENTNFGTEQGTTDANALLGGQTDAASLRALLIKSGMDKNMLDKISDADLMKSYEDMLGKKQ